MSGERGGDIEPSQRIILEIDGQCLLSQALVADVNNACDRVEEAGENSILLLQVRGRAAFDVDSVWPGALGKSDVHLVNHWEQALRRVERLNTMTIATVEQTCTAVALEVLLATDYRLARSGFLIHFRRPFGDIWPSMSIYRLANQLGIGRSRQIVLLGTDLTAKRAIDLGLIDEVVDNLEAPIKRFIDSLDRGLRTDVSLRRRLLLDAIGMTFENALGVHLAASDRTVRRMHRT